MPNFLRRVFSPAPLEYQGTNAFNTPTTKILAGQSILDESVIDMSLNRANLSDVRRVQPLKLKSLQGRLVCGIFVGSRCPTAWWYTETFQAMEKEFPDMAILAILSNRNDELADVARLLKERGLHMLLIDDRKHQKIKAQLGARVTPTAFVLDKTGILRYVGAIDGGNRDRLYLVSALRNLKDGKEVSPKKTSTFGCNIT